MNQITPHELLKLTEENDNVTLIDVRTPAEFNEVHLNCARNIPLDRLDPKAFVDENQIDEDQQVVLICRSGSRGKMACDKFQKNGFMNVINVEGGTEACLALDFEVTRGKKMMSLERQVRIAAGSLVVIGVALGLLVHPGFFGLAGFVGAGLVFAGVTDTCGMGMLISRMPWNQVAAKNQECDVPVSSQEHQAA